MDYLTTTNIVVSSPLHSSLIRSIFSDIILCQLLQQNTQRLIQMNTTYAHNQIQHPGNNVGFFINAGLIFTDYYEMF